MFTGHSRNGGFKMPRIPSNIAREHILSALKKIDNEGIPKGRSSKKYELIYDGKRYPPKYVISLANLFANGEELNSSSFHGGTETNRCLEKLGFEITSKEDVEKSDAINDHTWKVLADNVALKKMDKSIFLHNSTGIPVEVMKFFGINFVRKGTSSQLTLRHDNKNFTAYIEAFDHNSPCTILSWKDDFARILHKQFPNLASEPIYSHVIRFTRIRNDIYEVSFQKDINLNLINNDIESDIIESTEDPSSMMKEGAIKYFYGKRYERDAANRKKAIEIHGLKCKVCGFDFFEFYGERGEGFIEIHHVKPLSVLKGEAQAINPVTDLVPLCSNCHRMIHRRWDNVLTIDQLKDIVKLQKRKTKK